MATPTPQKRTIADLDVPNEQVVAEAKRIAAERKAHDCQVLRDAMARTHSESDRLAYALDLRLIGATDDTTEWETR